MHLQLRVLQFFLNLTHFGMNIQEALAAPSVFSQHLPLSFCPRSAFPGRVSAEDRVSPEVIAEFGRRGHEIVVAGSWAHGKPMAIRCHREHGVIAGGVSRRGNIGYAMGW